MPRLPLFLGLSGTLCLAACVETAPPPDTCTDASGTTYIRPAEGCPAYVPPKPRKPTVAARPKALPQPVVEEKTGGDGGSDGGGGWGG